MNEPATCEDSFVQDLDHCLVEHARSAAQRALAALGGPLNADNLDWFLTEPNCLRYPTCLVFDASPLEPHQFGEPVIKVVNGSRVCRLYLHPHFSDRQDALPYLVAYMAGAINYGAIATPDLCETLGAMLVCYHREEFYRVVCEFADEIGV